MQSHSENVILFPKWRKSLEHESLQALKQKRYPEALEKLNKLLSYQVYKHEVFIGKLICLMELGHYDEAIDLCESLLKQKDENYYHYLHIYLTILFQTNQYDTLMEQVEDELENDAQMPDVVKEQFEQLYTTSMQMRSDLITKTAKTDLEDLKEAVKMKNHVNQWHLVQKLRRIDMVPPVEVTGYLQDDQIHPVVKTVLFKWLQDHKLAETVEIHKLGLQATCIPNDIPQLNEHIIIKEIRLFISELEQENPTLYQLLDQLLYRYTYVRFPIMASSKNVKEIAIALINIGQQYLHISKEDETYSEKVQFYMEEIKLCESLYLSIIED